MDWIALRPASSGAGERAGRIAPEGLGADGPRSPLVDPAPNDDVIVSGLVGAGQLMSIVGDDRSHDPERVQRITVVGTPIYFVLYPNG
ncbi:MAG TPA: hypothetical protein VIP57_16880 [Candidatus Dormibacteraeota bacterium]